MKTGIYGACASVLLPCWQVGFAECEERNRLRAAFPFCNGCPIAGARRVSLAGRPSGHRLLAMPRSDDRSSMAPLEAWPRRGGIDPSQRTIAALDMGRIASSSGQGFGSCQRPRRWSGWRSPGMRRCGHGPAQTIPACGRISPGRSARSTTAHPPARQHCVWHSEADVHCQARRSGPRPPRPRLKSPRTPCLPQPRSAPETRGQSSTRRPRDPAAAACPPG